MTVAHLWIISILNICLVNCSVLLWSDKKLDILPLQKFTDDEFSHLLEKLDYPEVKAYTTHDQKIPNKFKEFVEGRYSAYNTNDDLISINTTDLSGNETFDFQRIKSDLEYVRINQQNSLFMIISTSTQRNKRELGDEELITSNPEPKGPVAYIGKSKTDERYGIIYSSSALLLKINKTELYLGETLPDMISVDKVPRTSITRLNVNVPKGDGYKTILRFIFSWVDYYWYLTSVKISDTSFNNDYDLMIDKEVSASKDFSYHCPGLTSFSDPSNDVYLYLYDMQVQIDAKKEKFDDAFDCIFFTTIPICSGLFVCGLLSIVLLFSLIALGDIKTMDKFDNHKTKQLSITVNE
ncbi:hypothetical protein HHI36_007406 [Cryptolaemus montrouzieri]|uniref:Vacuolar ATP synthase subunit S1 n=1 Tax=Cryptolaemus montrouzieri TaxID=559131 RepID=A0ABD2MPF9_9CUCU